MPDISIPQARRIVVDTTGAQIVQEESPAVCLPEAVPSRAVFGGVVSLAPDLVMLPTQ